MILFYICYHQIPITITFIMSQSCQDAEILTSKLETLDVNDTEDESDVTVTIRYYDVYDKINKFLTCHDLDAGYADDIFYDIHHQCSIPFQISPQQLLFEEKMVDEILLNIDVENSFTM